MKSKFKLTDQDPRVISLIPKTDHKVLARWAIDCVERVMHYFEDEYPGDNRPRQALDTLEVWIQTGEFNMKVIRNASLYVAHAAAREIKEDNAAKSVARAAGQAVATAHVPTHSYGGAIYALQAIFRATNSMEEVEKEREWQYKHLVELRTHN